MRNTEARKMKARNIKTKNSDNDLGIFKIFLTLLVRLHIMLAITKEQIIRRRKSLRLQKIRKQMLRTTILKKTELFNFNLLLMSFQNILIHLIWHNYWQIS